MTLIRGLNIHTGTESIPQGAVLVEAGIVKEIFTAGAKLPLDKEILTFPADHHLIPAMIDMHIHGSQGADVMDGTIEALQKIANTLQEQGTCGFLATTMTEQPEKIEHALINAAQFAQQQAQGIAGGAKLLGIHLEGPFISPEFVGAQSPKYVQEPNIELFKRWQKLANNLIKMVTIAPEQPNGLEFVEYLQSTGVIASFGHSGADYAVTQQSIDAGVTHATHLFNAMRGIHHREPGAVTALLLRPDVYAELIADGHHLAPSIIDLSYRLKTADKLILVTDATRAQCCSEGTYELGGQPIYLKDNAVRLKNGALAGSILTLPQAIRHVQQATGCSVTDLVKMTSTNPAIQLRLAQYGAITTGRLANLVVLDSTLNIVKTINLA